MSARALLVLRLAARDLRFEWRLAACLLAGLAAVLAPLLVLFGLKNGVIERVRAELIENPMVRQITNTATRSFDADFFARMAARPDVAFVIGRARSLNAEASFSRDEPGAPQRLAEIVPTGANDPLLRGLAPPTASQVVPQANFAARIGLSPGARVVLRVPAAAGREPLALRLTVAGIAPLAATGREAVMVHPDIARLVGAYIDQQLPATATPADAAALPPAPAEGFRLHVRGLADVITLDRLLRAEDIPVASRADDVAALFGMDRALTLLFVMLAGLGGLGYVVSLGVSLYANVERKQRELSLLRLIGLRRADLALFTVLQGAVIGLLGATVAGIAALLMQGGLNAWWPLGDASEGRAALSVIGPWHVAGAVAVSLTGAALAALAAGLRAANIQPAEGMRYG
jgi:putative ABC transport system permease protein